jgi:hypothetical protein
MIAALGACSWRAAQALYLLYRKLYRGILRLAVQYPRQPEEHRWRNLGKSCLAVMKTGASF